MADIAELEAIKKAYNGNQEMERNLDILLEEYPAYLDYKSFLLDVLRQSYCLGFLYNDK